MLDFSLTEFSSNQFLLPCIYKFYRGPNYTERNIEMESYRPSHSGTNFKMSLMSIIAWTSELRLTMSE